MYIRNYREIPEEQTGVDGLTVRWGINASQGATNFSMRLLELAPMKSTPMHQHDSEHEIYVLVGKGEVETEDNVYRSVKARSFTWRRTRSTASTTQARPSFVWLMQ